MQRNKKFDTLLQVVKYEINKIRQNKRIKHQQKKNKITRYPIKTYLKLQFFYFKLYYLIIYLVELLNYIIIFLIIYQNVNIKTRIINYFVPYLDDFIIYFNDKELKNALLKNLKLENFNVSLDWDIEMEEDA